jgi:ribosome recycling factor
MINFTQLKEKLEQTQEWLVGEFAGVRTGRAVPALLDNIKVDAYGMQTPLKQLANIGVEDVRTLRVNPFDVGQIKDVEKAITAADLGVGVQATSSEVRVIFPELTGERREQLLKIAGGKLEEARVTVRGARDEMKKDLIKQEKDGEISKDENHDAQEEMQKMVEEANNKFEELFKSKEEEIRG